MAIEYTGFQRPSRLALTTRMAQAEFSGPLTFRRLALACGCGGHGTPGLPGRCSGGRRCWPGWAKQQVRGVGREGLRRYLESSQHAADESRVAHRIG